MTPQVRFRPLAAAESGGVFDNCRAHCVTCIVTHIIDHLRRSLIVYFIILVFFLFSIVQRVHFCIRFVGNSKFSVRVWSLRTHSTLRMGLSCRPPGRLIGISSELVVSMGNLYLCDLPSQSHADYLEILHPPLHPLASDDGVAVASEKSAKNRSEIL